MKRRTLLRNVAGAPVFFAARSSRPEATPPPFYSSVGQFIQLRPPLPEPRQPIHTAGGSLIDFPALLGKVVVLNFWATWCIPCDTEMPSLDRLAAQASATGAVVLAVSIDQAGKAAVIAYYQRLGLRHLKVYSDPAQQLGHLGDSASFPELFPLHALPTTFLIDANGMVVGYMPGAAQWDSSQARRLIAWVAEH